MRRFARLRDTCLSFGPPALRRNARALVVALVLGAVGSALMLSNRPLAGLDATIQDAVIANRAPESYLAPGTSPARDPRNFITIVAIDERTLSELGAYNGGYQRAYHAQVIENLLAAPPRVIALDLGFFEPTSDDATFAAALDHARSLPVPTSIILSGAGLPQPGHLASTAPNGEIAFEHALNPVPLLAERADVALANVVPDDRGTIRSMPLLAYVGGVERPSLGLAATARYLRRPAFIDGRSASGGVELAGRDIPLDGRGLLRVNYFGPPSLPYSADSAFRVVSFVDVLRGRVDPATWRGGLVFVGALGATGLADDYWTPASQQGRKMAGVEIHANVAATLLSSSFMQTLPPIAEVLLVLGVGVLLALLAANLGLLTTMVACPVLLVGFMACGAWVLYAYGLLVPIGTPVVVGLVAFLAETAQRLVAEQRQAHAIRAALTSERLHDPITGLANRTQFLGDMRHAILSAEQTADASFSLLLLDVDHFKDVNDALGHVVGDALLKQVAERLASTLQTPHARLARLGGDEFAVLVPGADADHARSVCTRLLGALEAPMPVQGQKLSLSASVGICQYPLHGQDPETLLRRADVAMYAAKQTRAGYVIYSSEQELRSAERLQLVFDLREAASAGELALYFQPKLECRSGRIMGVEALVRWRHPRQGLITPDRFIPLAEETGLIRPITRWVLDAAVRQSRAWLDKGLAVKMAVNLSTHDLDDDLPGHISSLLAHWAVPAELLSFEITESALLVEPSRALRVLQQLDALGIHASLDDFGTGYSSFTYLQQLPLQELKIDASFVRELTRATRDQAIVRSTIELGHRLGLTLVAEGVEDQTTLDVLTQLGCDQAQGFFLSKPLPADELADWVRSAALRIAA